MEKIESSTNIFQKRIIWRLAIIFGIVVFSAAIIFFLSGLISKKADSISNKRKQITRANASAEAFSGLVKNSQIAESYYISLSDSLPEKDKLINFSKEISELATSKRLISGFVFKETGNQQNLAGQPLSIGFSMTLRGEFSDFAGFLEEVSKMPYWINFESFEVSGPGIEDLAKGIRAVSISAQGRVFIKNSK